MVPSVDKDTHTVLHLTAVYYGEDEKRDRRGNIRFIRRGSLQYWRRSAG